MLKYDLDEGDSITIGDAVVVRLERKSGRRARIVIEAVPELRPISVLKHRPPMPGDQDIARG